tara:strand:+ start:1180 stop:1362 length:183 start_codon:yes stop_codon:yes gene_type:complete
LEVLDKIYLLTLCDFANAAFSEFRVPNLAINLFFSLMNWTFVKIYKHVKLEKVNAKADQT